MDVGPFMLLQALTVVLLMPAVSACAYYLVLCLVGLWPRRPRAHPTTMPVHTFAIVMPAHNEAPIIPDALQACRLLDYPGNKYKVYVIADNCTDRTAALATEAGAICLERHDLDHPGKGPALTWALEQVLEDRPDAVIILDADCRLDPHSLRTFDARLTAGANVLQANYVASNPDESAVSYAAGVCNRVENDLFYAPKSRLGWSVLLRGTGMVFRREVLERCPWQAHSIVEDVEHTVRLFDAGISVEFVDDVRVVSAFPAQQDQLAVQRARWIGGNVALGWTHGLRLMAEGIARRQMARIDLGWTLIVSVRSVIVLQAALTAAAGLLCMALIPSGLSIALGLTGLAGLALHAFCFVAGAWSLGLTGHRARMLLEAPGVFARWLGIASRVVVGGQPTRWERTPR